jgi:hypothetical protein
LNYSTTLKNKNPKSIICKKDLFVTFSLERKSNHPDSYRDKDNPIALPNAFGIRPTHWTTPLNSRVVIVESWVAFAITLCLLSCENSLTSIWGLALLRGTKRPISD